MSATSESGGLQAGTAQPVLAATGHLSLRTEGPAEVGFLFQQQQRRLGGAFGVSVLVHVMVALAILAVVRLVPDEAREALLPEPSPDEIVWIAEPGPGGGGGGGNKRPEPPRRAELPGREKLTVPALKPAEVTLEEQKPEEPPPQPLVNIPAETMAAATQSVVGVIESTNASSLSTGSGDGTGAGAGRGSGIGEGFGGGMGGGAFRIGSGVESPRLLRSVRPNYTSEAMRAKVQGVVRLEGVVMADGTVGQVRVIRSLDPVFGLDEEAIKAAKQFRFTPGTRFGEPVNVIVSFEIEFTLR